MMKRLKLPEIVIYPQISDGIVEILCFINSNYNKDTTYLCSVGVRQFHYILIPFNQKRLIYGR